MYNLMVNRMVSRRLLIKLLLTKVSEAQATIENQLVILIMKIITAAEIYNMKHIMK